MTEAQTDTKVDNMEENSIEPQKNEDRQPKKEDADESEVLEKIAERLRFFFSDANLRIDSFMRREVVGSEDDPSDGYVKIETLLKFNTIKKISDDPSMIVKAAKIESISSRIKLSDDETSICRVVPFTMDMMDGHVPLSLRVTNIPMKKLENGKSVYAVSRQDVENLFRDQKDFGPVALVRMQYERRERSDNKKTAPGPKGWALVEFETVEDLQKAEDELCRAEGDETPKRVLKLLDNDLQIENFKKWIDSKPDRKRKREKSDENEEKKVNDEKNVRAIEFEPFTIDWQKGCVIRLKGLGDTCDREAIIAAVEEFMGKPAEGKKMAFADYSRGQSDGAVRFHEHSDKIAEFQKKLNDGEITIAGSKVDTALLLEGEEEENYYKSFIDFKNKQRSATAEEKFQKRQRRSGRRKGYGKRRN